jgi:hypothetical protein
MGKRLLTLLLVVHDQPLNERVLGHRDEGVPAVEVGGGRGALWVGVLLGRTADGAAPAGRDEDRSVGDALAVADIVGGHDAVRAGKRDARRDGEVAGENVKARWRVDFAALGLRPICAMGE